MAKDNKPVALLVMEAAVLTVKGVPHNPKGTAYAKGWNQCRQAIIEALLKTMNPAVKIEGDNNG